jgi:DNA-binding MarR family transcriptional regulator
MSDPREALRTWLALLGAAGALKKSVDARLRERFDLSISRFDVLSALERAGPEGLRAGALSQRLMVTEGNTTQVTAPLLRDGLVERRSTADDGRVAIFRLTRKGRALFERAAGAHRDWIAAAFAGLPNADAQSLRALVARLRVPDDRPKEEDAA